MAQRLAVSHTQQPPPLTLPPDARVQANDIPARLSRGENIEPGEQGSLVGMMPPPDFGPYLKSLAKPLLDMFGAVFKPAGAAVEAGTSAGIPPRLRFTNWDARKGMIQLHGADIPGPPLEVSPTDLDRLINAGHIELEQPPDDPRLQQKLKELLQFDAHTGDPRNPTIGVPRTSNIGGMPGGATEKPMRRSLDRVKPTLRKLPKD